MIEKDQTGDEYQLDDPDMIDVNSFDESETTSEANYSAGLKPGAGEHQVKKKAIVAVSVFIALMIIYKFISHYFSDENLAPPKEKKESVKAAAVQPKIVQTEPAPPNVSIKQVSAQPAASLADDKIQEIDKKFNAMEIVQRNTRTEVSSVSNKLGGISSSMDEISSKINQLNNIVAELNNKIEDQAHDIDRLTALSIRKKKSTTPKKANQPTPILRYYIQAVIPGRAWLIDNNGKSITVREGSKVTDYGVVKIIDPLQGKIITSSGKNITFSPDGS